MEQNKRIEWVDIGKFICIFFVMIHHWGSEQEGLIRPLWLDSFYQPFFLVGFCFLSGFTYKHRIGFKNHLLKKTKQLMVPFIIYGIGIISLGFVLTAHPENHTSFISEILQHFIQVRFIYGQLWFLAALFVAYIPFYFIIDGLKSSNISKKQLIIIAIILYLITRIYWLYIPGGIFPWNSNSLPWHLDYVPMELCFMIFGYLYKDIYQQTIKYFTIKNLFIITLVYIFIIYIINSLNLNGLIIIRLLVSFIKQGISILFLVVLSNCIKTNKLFSYIGSNTLNYFAMHGKVQQAIQLILRKVCPTYYNSLFTNDFYAIIFLLVFTTLLAVILIIPSKLINKYFPFICGKTK